MGCAGELAESVWSTSGDMRTDCQDWFPHDYAVSPSLPGMEWADSICDPNPHFPIHDLRAIEKEEREERLLVKLLAFAGFIKWKIRRRERSDEAKYIWTHRRWFRRFAAYVLFLRRRYARWKTWGISIKSGIELEGCSSRVIVVTGDIVERVRDKLIWKSVAHPTHQRPTWYLWRDKWIIRFYWSTEIYGRLLVITKATEKLIKEFAIMRDRWQVRHDTFVTVSKVPKAPNRQFLNRWL